MMFLRNRKPRSKSVNLEAGAAAVFVAIPPPAHAQTLNRDASGSGGPGTWDAGTTSDWFNGASNVPCSSKNTASHLLTAGKLTFNDNAITVNSGSQ